MVAKTRTGSAAQGLKLGKKRTKNPSAEHDTQESGVEIDRDAQSNMDKAAKQEARAAGREKRRGRKAAIEAKRETARKEWVDSGKALQVCSLATVEVKRGNDGFRVSVKGSKTFAIAPDQATQILRDLETAIAVMRNQQ
jgi:hypothetical protein